MIYSYALQIMRKVKEILNAAWNFSQPLNLIIHTEKFILVCARCIENLGSFLNSEDMTVSLSDVKKEPHYALEKIYSSFPAEKYGKLPL